jgi:hypothetical protein
MNDTEILTWVAEHLVKFDLSFKSAYIMWIDNGGIIQHRIFRDIMSNEPDVEVLRHCVTAIAAP